jgi:hypothetical protein
MKKIAFLFLIYDIINLEELWYIFFNNVDKNKYTIYIHYKNNVQLKYFEKYKLNKCIETKYANISLVYAQNLLLHEAIKDENNQHFIFVSNSCVPFKNFEYIYNNLLPEKSYFNLMSKKYFIGNYKHLSNYIKKQNIQKASQWCILNRKHSILMIMIMKSECYFNIYKNIHAPDEVCYITNIFVNNLQNEIVATNYLATGATTFTNWSDMVNNYKFLVKNTSKEPCILKNYDTISDEELQLIIDSSSLFGRKFSKECIYFFNTPVYLSLFDLTNVSTQKLFEPIVVNNNNNLTTSTKNIFYNSYFFKI